MITIVILLALVGYSLHRLSAARPTADMRGYECTDLTCCQ